MGRKTHDKKTYEIEKEYSGYRIAYDENTETFYAKAIDKKNNLPDLNDKDSFNLKQRCRQAFSKMKATKFTQIKCLSHDFRGMKITSIKKVRKGSDRTPKRAVVRISYTDRGSSSFGGHGYEKDIPSQSSPIYEDSPENRTIINQINDKKIEVIALVKTLKLLDPEAVFRQYVEV